MLVLPISNTCALNLVTFEESFQRNRQIYTCKITVLNTGNCEDF